VVAEEYAKYRKIFKLLERDSMAMEKKNSKNFAPIYNASKSMLILKNKSAKDYQRFTTP
jgi:hypothetical protein